MTLKERARRLRRSMTDAERLLWCHLRDRRMSGFKFRRQWPIGPFIADFACVEARLIIEADGGQHLDSRTDDARTRYLESRGYRLLRFWNDEILRDTAVVLEVVNHELARASDPDFGVPHPNPSP